MAAIAIVVGASAFALNRHRSNACNIAHTRIALLPFPFHSRFLSLSRSLQHKQQSQHYLHYSSSSSLFHIYMHATTTITEAACAYNKTQCIYNYPINRFQLFNSNVHVELSFCSNY